MRLLQEAAIFVGDHITAPIRLKKWERKNGISGYIHRKTSFISTPTSDLDTRGEVIYEPRGTRISWEIRPIVRRGGR